MLEWKEWEYKHKRVPTPAGEAIGLILVMWENYGRRSPVVYFTEQAQRFVIDNIDAVIATLPKQSLNVVESFDEEEEFDETDDT